MEQPQTGVPPQPFVCDGRVDQEKLLELLRAEGEFSSLDFKREINLGDKRKKLEFIKDCAAMGNQPEGGYLVIGAEDDGVPVPGTDLSGVNLDSAALKQIVEGYVDGHIDIRSQTHSVALQGVTYHLAVIYVAPPRDGFPLVTKKLGDASEGRPVFQQGVVYTREGSQNVPASHKTWDQILHKLQQQVRSATRSDVDDLIHRVVKQMGTSGPAQPVAPDFDMDVSSFTAAVRNVLEANQPSLLKRVVIKGSSTYDQSIEDEDRRSDVLDKLAVLACEACLFDDTDTLVKVTEALYKIYKRMDENSQIRSHKAARYGLEIISRIMVIGSLALRTENYQVLRSIVLKPMGTPQYGFTSWIRHGLIAAANSSIPEDGKAGVVLISAARQILVDTPQLSPDYPITSTTEEAQPVSLPDVVIDSLLQFDFLWCCIALNENPGGGFAEFYPGCSAYHQSRVQPIISKLDAADGTFRALTFGNAPDAQIARVIREVYDAAKDESYKYGGFWPSSNRFPNDGFIQSNARRES